MGLFTSKGSTEMPPTWFIVEIDNGSAIAYARQARATAMDEFGRLVRSAEEAGEGYTPLDQTRRLVVTGPDWVMQPEDHTDPLPDADVALKAVLTAQEYSLIVHGTVARALLES